VIAGLGAGSVVVGLTMFALGAMNHTSYGATGAVSPNVIIVVPTATSTGPDAGLMVAGGLTMGIGLAATIGGMVMALTNDKTTVTQTALYDAAVATRTPMWREPAAGPAEVARPTIVPLFSARF
jgi:hypothetical protein